MELIKIITVSILLPLLSCSTDDGGSYSKDLFSIWERTDNNTVIDLTTIQFSVSTPFFFIFEDGAQCNCDVLFIGSQPAGSYAINSCRYKYNSGSEDPGCNAINTTGSYTKSSDTLNFTPSSGGTITYK